MKILTGLTSAAALIAAISIANAQNTTTGMTPGNGTKMDCSEAGMSNANNSMMKMSDATKKEAAQKEMGMAKELMAKKDMAGCKMHMDKAAGMMQ
ncbi:MAG: hypothetical protein ABI790_17840 [Betaproteobacteria bacterium]